MDASNLGAPVIMQQSGLGRLEEGMILSGMPSRVNSGEFSH